MRVSSKNGFAVRNYLFGPNRILIGCHSDAIDKGTHYASTSMIGLSLQLLVHQGEKTLIWLGSSHERINQWKIPFMSKKEIYLIVLSWCT